MLGPFALDMLIRANTMRSVFAMSLLVALCTSADAAPMHDSRARQHVIVRPSQDVIEPGRFSVPGWTDAQTQHWLNAATSCRGCY
jgi:hypothetical protein